LFSFGVFAVGASSEKTNSGSERKIVVWKHGVKDFDKDRSVTVVKGKKIKDLRLINATVAVL
jgi:hypothetical protein